jgi:hypothetical protein
MVRALPALHVIYLPELVKTRVFRQRAIGCIFVSSHTLS